MNCKEISLSWQNISVEIKNKPILSNICGYCNRGTSLAIMGPSGAGKTTLLAALAGHKNSDQKVTGEVSGYIFEVKANGASFNEAQFYNFSAFVYQNNVLNEALTVRQTLEFTARLKFPDGPQAQQRVEQLITDFGLQKCQYSYIGGTMVKGISGGEKKRVSIAVEMVAKPGLLILDEPTSGLDSHMAYKLITQLMRLCSREGRTVIFTIHQPSHRIFMCLDRLMVLSRGECVYQGKAKDLLGYMLNLGVTVPAKSTVPDFFMLQISQPKPGSEICATPFTAETYCSSLAPQIQNQIQSLKYSDYPNLFSHVIATSFLTQLQVLLFRQIKMFRRNPMKFGRTVFNAVISTILIGVIFYHGMLDGRPIDGHTYTPAQLLSYFINAQGTAFMGIVNVVMGGLVAVTLTFPVERKVFSKEIASKTYSTLPYFLAKLVVEMVSLMVAIILSSVVVYVLQGYTLSFSNFFRYMLVLCSAALVGNSIGFWVGSLFKDPQQSSIMGPGVVLPLMMFSGLYNKLESIPGWIAWMQYISPFRYGLHALLINQFTSQNYLVVEDGRDSNIFYYRKQFAINFTYSENTGILIGLAVFYYLLAFLFLKTLASRVRT